jgi:hypothetical protein
LNWLCLFERGSIHLDERRGFGAAETERECRAACNAAPINPVFCEFVSHQNFLRSTKNLYARSSIAGSIFFRKRPQLAQRMIEDKPVSSACQLFSSERQRRLFDRARKDNSKRALRAA